MEKTTYLWHLANHYHSLYNIIFFKSDIEDSFSKELPSFENNLPVLIIIDNISIHEAQINKIQEAIFKFYKVPKIFFVAERNSRYNAEVFSDFEVSFDYSSRLTYSHSTDFLNSLFEKIYALLAMKKGRTRPNFKEAIKKEFIGIQQNGSLVYRILNLILRLGAKHHIEYKWDWIEWDQYIESLVKKDGINGADLKLLFSFVALFYQFGVPLPLDFYLNYFNPSGVSPHYIRRIVNNKLEKPIILENEKLYLRHEVIGKFYFLEESEREARQELSRNFFGAC
jgi:hypothetical protein